MLFLYSFNCIQYCLFSISDTKCDMKREWEEIKIDVPWGFVAGKWYGDRNQTPVIALHGWQDNAGSFDRLIPLLPPCIPILAIDLPGHGKSSHYPTGMVSMKTIFFFSFN